MYRRREHHRIICVDQQAGHAVNDDLGYGSHARSDNGESGAHTLKKNETEPLPSRGVHKNIGLMKNRRDIIAPALEHHPVGDPKTSRKRFEVPATAAVADYLQHQNGIGAGQRGESRD